MGNSFVITKLTNIEAKKIDKAAEKLGCSMQDLIIASALKVSKQINNRKTLPRDIKKLAAEVSERCVSGQRGVGNDES